MIAALFVEPGGVYYNVPGVQPWPEWRDARTYQGPWRVIAHPPCERWGRYWGGAPWQKERKTKGADHGCFIHALRCVRLFGGVIEHPEGSHAWRTFCLNRPPRVGGWVLADVFGGWTCCVEQGYYGHRARKATWLYVHGIGTPDLKWGSSGKRERMDEGFHSKEERRRVVRTGICQRLSRNQRLRTPVEFRDLLISMVS